MTDFYLHPLWPKYRPSFFNFVTLKAVFIIGKISLAVMLKQLAK